MWIHWLRLVFGAGLLYWGAEWLVFGAAGLARALRISPLVVGLTVVAYGTSAPELVVSSMAALNGQSAIAVGNVVGSNIANLGLILGITALLCPPRVEATLIRREIPVLVGAALLLALMMADGRIGRVDAAVLFAGAVAFTAWTVRINKAVGGAAAEVNAPAPLGVAGGLKLGAFALLGLALLVFGGDTLVDGATGVARAFGMSERLVGLTIVAVGTSLPELATSLVAAVRGHSALAVGNVVGSNIFNVLLILGVAGLVSPMDVPFATYRVDLSVMVGMSLLGAAVMRGPRLVTRTEGAVLAGGYAAFLVALAL